jgi:hypothetical protein
MYACPFLSIFRNILTIAVPTFVSSHCILINGFVRKREGMLRLINDSSVNKSLLSKTDHTTVCPWKGTASYYSINLDSESFIWPSNPGIENSSSG